MKILAIETSCDETAAAVVSKSSQENQVKILSNVVASSLSLHAKTGGVIPNVAAREQLKFIIPVIKQALIKSNLYPPSSKIQLQSSTIYRPDIDAIAVTVGPGLIGSLLIGVETAKTLSYLWNKPIIPVNHLLGHIYANWIKVSNGNKAPFDTSDTFDTFSTPMFPCIALLISGGHTDLLLMKNHHDFKWLGGTLDDASGEAFDKIGRLLSLPYPAGPTIEKLSERGDASRFTFPRPMIGSKDFDFSFSGLKAAVWREVNKLKRGVTPVEGLSTARTESAEGLPEKIEGALAGGKLAAGPQLEEKVIADICASVQKSIIEVLVRKTVKAAKEYNVKSILLGGGVSANQTLRDQFILNTKYLIPNTKIFFPEKKFSTDNAAMIGAYGCFHPKSLYWKKVTANPELYFD